MEVFIIHGKIAIMFSGNIRRDGSNIYGVGTNDKWKPLSSLGASYVMSKETFFEKLSSNYLKLKSTLGYSGNVDLSRSALPISCSATNSTINDSLPYERIGTINNPSLRWEEMMENTLRFRSISVWTRIAVNVQTIDLPITNFRC